MQCNAIQRSAVRSSSSVEKRRGLCVCGVFPSWYVKRPKNQNRSMPEIQPNSNASVYVQNIRCDMREQRWFIHGFASALSRAALFPVCHCSNECSEKHPLDSFSG